MKKLIFSLVVVTAFSFSSMANDISEPKEKSVVHKIELNAQESIFLITGFKIDIRKLQEKGKLEKNELFTNNEKNNMLLAGPCMTKYWGVYYLLIDMGFNLAQSRYWALEVYHNCIKENMR
jgi:hypothetical protein